MAPSRSHSPLRLGFVAVVALTVFLGACEDEMCRAKPLPEPWEPYATLIPSETVICGKNRGAKDDYPPTQLFVYYKGRDAATAFNDTTEKFKGAGWTLSDFFTSGEGSSKAWDGSFSKDGVKIKLAVNKNQAGVQGSFKLEK